MSDPNISNIRKGCPTYLWHLAEIPKSNGFLEAQRAMHAAVEHRENCPRCIAMNTGQLFGDREVIVVEENHAD